MSIVVTKHAKKRLKKRFNAGDIQGIAELAHKEGIDHLKAKGSLHRYITSQAYRDGPRDIKNIKIYRNFVFVFKSHSLITAFQLPSRWQGKVEQYTGHSNDLPKT